MTCHLESFFNSAFGSAVSGGFVGGLFTYGAVVATVRHERHKAQQSEADEIKAICLAIETEISSLAEKYKESIGKSLLECAQGDYFNMFYPIEEDYFSVFHGNTAWIGKIKSADVRQSVVTAYIAMKGLIDSYRHNNQMLSQLEAYLQQALTLPQVGGTQQKFLNELQNVQHKQLIEYAPVLRQAHHETLAKVSEALTKLHSYYQSL